MSTSVIIPPSRKPTERLNTGLRYALVGAGFVLAFWWSETYLGPKSNLFLIGLGIGAALFYGSFGFSAAYRNAFVKRDMGGIYAQLIMIGLASVLFAPLLSTQQASGAWAPIGLQVAVGSFLFGTGMQLGGACASGTLFSIGGGSLRMLITLFFFCIGTFFSSLHLDWWGQLPDWGTQSLGHLIGWKEAVTVQITLFIAIALLLKRIARGAQQTPLWNKEIGWQNLITGPWPLILSAIALALLNFATLVEAGHPWTVTWAFTLWGAKLATLTGWMPDPQTFWTAPFQAAALKGTIWEDTTSMMNIAVVFGAFGAALLSAKWTLRLSFPPKALFAAIIGGLAMGYGARLAYGCNIGALFSGMASTSLHAWLWIICAMLGTWIGIRLRPIFELDK